MKNFRLSERVNTIVEETLGKVSFCNDCRGEEIFEVSFNGPIVEDTLVTFKLLRLWRAEKATQKTLTLESFEKLIKEFDKIKVIRVYGWQD